MAETKHRLKEMIVERLFLNDSADDIGDDDDLRERYALDRPAPEPASQRPRH